MEILYDTFQIQPPINSELLMDIDTAQKLLILHKVHVQHQMKPWWGEKVQEK